MKVSTIGTYNPRTLLIGWRVLLVISAFAVAWISGDSPQESGSVAQSGAFASDQEAGAPDAVLQRPLVAESHCR